MEITGVVYMIIIAFGICVVIGAAIRGFKLGLVKIIDKVLSLVAAIAVLFFILRTVRDWNSHAIPRAAAGILILLVLGALYRVFHMLFGTMHLLAKLPILSAANKVLGAVAGAVEGAALFYALVYIAVNYIFV